MNHIVILGNGISGITTARHIRKKSDARITVISAETAHFFSRTALMYIYMGHMKYEHTKPYEDWFWEKNDIELKQGYVEKIAFDKKELFFTGGQTLSYDELVLSVGSKSNYFNWPGQDLKGVQGLYSFQDLENMELYTKNIENAVVVGGGLIGIEMAEMLNSRKIPVSFLVREQSFWSNILPAEESDLVNRHIREHHIDLRLETELKEILADNDGRVRAVITQSGEEIPCQFVGLTAGVRPNVDFLKNTDLAINRGILVNHYFETNIPNVYAIGDCAEFEDPLPQRRPIEQVWYTGRMHGEILAQTLCGKRTAYTPGPWFNSAKFFDIEYQTYGQVPPKLGDNEAQFYWEHGDGRKCVKFVFQKDTMQLLGINVFGIRMRHEVAEKWLLERRDMPFVMTHLKSANFDPEFFKRHETEIVEAYNEQFPNHQAKIRKRGFFQKLMAS